MHSEMKHFTRVNQNLALIVEDLRLRQEGLTNEVHKMKKVLEGQGSEKRKFKEDLSEMLLTATTDKKLKSGVINLHKRWVLGEDQVKGRVEKDSYIDYYQNRRHFEMANK